MPMTVVMMAVSELEPPIKMLILAVVLAVAMISSTTTLSTIASAPVAALLGQQWLNLEHPMKKLVIAVMMVFAMLGSMINIASGTSLRVAACQATTADGAVMHWRISRIAAT